MSWGQRPTHFALGDRHTLVGHRDTLANTDLVYIQCKHQAVVWIWDGHNGLHASWQVTAPLLKDSPTKLPLRSTSTVRSVRRVRRRGNAGDRGGPRGPSGELIANVCIECGKGPNMKRDRLRRNPRWDKI